MGISPLGFPSDDLKPDEPKPKYHSRNCHWCEGVGKEPVKPTWVVYLEHGLIYVILIMATMTATIWIGNQSPHRPITPAVYTQIYP